MDILNKHILSIIALMPLVATAMFALVPFRYLRSAKIASAVVMVFRFVLALMTFILIDKTGEFDFVEKAGWIKLIGAEYFVAIDSASGLLLLATTAVAMCAGLISISKNNEQSRADLLISTLIFSATSLAVVAVDAMFFASVFAGLAFLVLIVSGRVRQTAGGAALLIFASLCMVTAMFYAGTKAGSFNVLSMYAHRFLIGEETFVFATSLLAIAITSGVFPFQGTLRSVMRGSAGVAESVGALALVIAAFYAAYRFVLPVEPVLTTYFSEGVVIYLTVAVFLSLIGAISSKSAGKLLSGLLSAQASLALVGLLCQSADAATGAFIYISVMSVAFLPAAYVAKRFFLDKNDGGNGVSIEHGKALSAISFALPSGFVGTGMFVGTFYIYLGFFQIYPVIALGGMVALALVSSVVFYSAWKIFYSGPTAERTVPGLSFSECAAMSVAMFIVFYSGIFPAFISQRVFQSAEAFVALSTRTKSVMLVPANENIDKTKTQSERDKENTGE